MYWDPIRLGIASGILSGIYLFMLTLFAMATGIGVSHLLLLENTFPGYSISVAGSLLGLAYGFVCGGVAGFLLAWVYNLLGPRKDG